MEKSVGVSKASFLKHASGVLDPNLNMCRTTQRLRQLRLGNIMSGINTQGYLKTVDGLENTRTAGKRKVRFYSYQKLCCMIT